MTGQPGRSGGKREGVGRPPGGSGGRDRPMCSRSRNTPTPTTAYVLIGSTVPAKRRSRFSLNSSATLPPWRSSRTATNRADLSIAAENSARRSKSSAMHCQRSRRLARDVDRRRHPWRFRGRRCSGREGDGRSAQAQIAGQRKARIRRSAPKIASAAMASRNARGIFL